MNTECFGWGGLADFRQVRVNSSDSQLPELLPNRAHSSSLIQTMRVAGAFRRLAARVVPVSGCVGGNRIAGREVGVLRRPLRCREWALARPGKPGSCRNVSLQC
jgi:hypothetical protein